MSAPFNAHRFANELLRLTASPERPVLCFEELDSTSTEVRRRLRDGAPPGIVVVAQGQTAGRGRQGRVWHSPDVGNLYLSVALEVVGPTREIVPMLPLAAGVSAVDAIRAFAPVDCYLKWPNDVLVRGRKLAGLLLETSSLETRRATLIAGLGVNIGSVEFPGELTDTATSLRIENRHHGVIETLAATWIHGLESGAAKIERGEGGAIIDAWRNRAEPFGRTVRVGDIEGTTVDLEKDGRLIIHTSDNRRVLVAGGIVEQLGDP